MMRISSLRKPEMQLEIFSWDVEISSSNSKFPVGQSGNFQFELEISSWNVKISSWNVEISSWNVEISSLKKSKFPGRTRNFQFKLEMSSWTKWKFPVRTRNFQLECRNFQFDQVHTHHRLWEFSARLTLLWCFKLLERGWFIGLRRRTLWPQVTRKVKI